MLCILFLNNTHVYANIVQEKERKTYIYNILFSYTCLHIDTSGYMFKYGHFRSRFADGVNRIDKHGSPDRSFRRRMLNTLDFIYHLYDKMDGIV